MSYTVEKVMKRAEDAFQALHATVDKLPNNCVVAVTISSPIGDGNEIHRFAVVNSILGHVESHDSRSIVHLTTRDFPG